MFAESSKTVVKMNKSCIAKQPGKQLKLAIQGLGSWEVFLGIRLVT